MTDSSMTHAPDVGDLVADRYLLRSLLGQGGMARVFLATDRRLDRDVALKLFRHGAEADELTRARSEMRVLASLSHPALVTLHDAVLSSTGPQFLVMELVPGATLREQIARGPLPSREVAAMAAELAEGLHVVHAAGIVHRDIKPSNILTWPSTLPERRFRVKLADFGIAALDGATRLTAPGTLIGTAAYLAPEQARGEAVTSATDVYALGLVLLEALTGRRAFPQPSAPEAIMARLSAPPAIPGHLAPEWRALLTAMTATDPAARPDALAVATAVTGLPHAPTPDMTTAAEAPAQAAVTGATLPLAPAVQSTDEAPVTTPPPPARRRVRRSAAIGLACLAVVSAVVVGVALATAPPDGDPTVPELPAVDAPLDTHLDDLMEAVTP